MEPKADIALIGLAVMGQNLILNMNDHGFTVVAYNRTVSKVDDFLNNEAKGTKPPGGRRHSGRGSTGLPAAGLQGKTALHVTHAAGFAGCGASSCGARSSRGLPMAGGPLAAKLRHLRGPAGNTQPLFLDRQAAARPRAPGAGPAKLRQLDVRVLLRSAAGDCG